MKTAFVLLALIGCALALHSGKQYTYTYKGRIGMGIPEIRNKVSGTGIKSDVIFQVHNGGKAIVQFTNIEVGEYLGDVECDIHNPLPIKYSPISGHAKALEEPFEVHFKNIHSDVMVVPKTDKEWLVNIRKSVALMFVTEPLRTNFESYKIGADIPKYFSKVEPTMHGMCHCDYTLVPMTQQTDVTEKEYLLKQMKEDVETHTFTGHPLYKMTRSVDFVNCKERVALVSSSSVNVSETVVGQPSNNAARMSVSTMKLIGQPGNFRVQSGFIEGFVAINPTGEKTHEKLISVTNQTIVLKSVSEIKTPITLTGSTRPVKTWFMELFSPYSPPSNPVPWINYHSLNHAAYYPILPETIATGIQITQSEIEKFTVRLDVIIKEIAQKLIKVGGVPNEKVDLWNTNEAFITSYLDTARSLVQGLDVNSLHKLFDKYYNDKSEEGQVMQTIFIDVCAASGYGAPIRMILDNVRSKKITNERIASIFVTLTNHFVVTPIIPDIMRYVKSLDLKETPFLTTTVWVNFATTLRKVCINPETAHHTIPHYIFGSQHCEDKRVYNELITFFKQKLENSNQPWEYMVIAQAISNLGSHENIHLFKNIIYNHKYDTTVKRHIIFALVPEMLSVSPNNKYVKEQVFEILMPLVEDFNVDSYLRQIAINTLTQWKPTPAFWQRLAVNSWKERSPVVGAFVYNMISRNAHLTTLKSHYENGSNVASLLLPFTRPYPISPKYSFYTVKQTVNPIDQTSTEYISYILRNDHIKFPMEVYFSVFTNFGSSSLKLIEFCLFNDHTPSMETDFTDKIKNMIPDMMHNTGTTEEVITNMMENGILNRFTLYLNMFEHSNLFTPINIETIARAFGKDGVNIINTWMTGKKMHLTKYFDATHTEILLPTEVGLPFLVKYNQPIINYAEGQTKVNVPGNSHPTIFDIINLKNIGFEFETNYRFAFKTVMNLRTIIPYSHKVISTGVETHRHINFPGKFNIEFTKENGIRNVTVQYKPVTQQFVLGSVQTVPYVVRKSMYPGEKPSEVERFEVITVRDDQHGQIKEVQEINKNTYGIYGKVHFEGDVYHPFTYGNIADFLRNPILSTKAIFTPTSKLSSAVLVVDFGQSETKLLSTSVALGLGFNDKYTKTGKSIHIGKQDLTFIQVYANTLLEGSLNRFFEVDFVVKSDYQNMKNSDVFLNFKHSKLPTTDSAEYCFKVSVTSPAIHDVRTLLRYIKDNRVDTSYNGVLRGGRTCNEEQIALFKGQMKVSPLRQQVLVKELTETCHFAPESPVEYFTTAPVYDELTFGVDFKQNIPDTFLNVTYKVFDAIQAYTYPHVYVNSMNVQHQPNKIFVSGERIIHNKHWNIKVETPKKYVVFDRLPLHPIVDQIVPYVYV